MDMTKPRRGDWVVGLIPSLILLVIILAAVSLPELGAWQMGTTW